MDIKHATARLMRRKPLLHSLVRHAARATATRFTIGVTGVIFSDEQELLLLEHVFRSRHPWGLPGGWVGWEELPQDALRRELQEEVELVIEVGWPVAVGFNELPGHLETCFLCRTEGEIGRLSREVLAARWVDPADLPPGVSPFDREMIARACEMIGQAGPPGARDDDE